VLEKTSGLIIPLSWAGWGSFLTALFCDRYLKYHLPYKQLSLAVREDCTDSAADTDSRGLKRIIRILDKSAVLNSQGSFNGRLSRMLRLMGKEEKPEQIIMQTFIWGLLGAMPFLIVPFLLKNWLVLLLYPVFSLFIFFQEIKKIKREYQQWQTEIIRDIPEVIDRLRIGFVAGRDYISVLKQAAQNSGQAMRRVLEQLVNDIQAVGSSEALRAFAADYDIPIMGKLSSALTIAIESGYKAAEAYFANIEREIRKLREESNEQIIQSKPEKVVNLYILLFALSVAALVLKGWEIIRYIEVLFI